MSAPDIDDPDLPLDRLFAFWPETARIFLRRGMLCYGCPLARFATVAGACREYGLDEARLRAQLRHAAFAERPRPGEED